MSDNSTARIFGMSLGVMFILGMVLNAVAFQ
jgi:hypothetical protein